MRLLELKNNGEFSLTKDLIDNIPPYAILSHTWGNDDEEATFQDLTGGVGKSKAGYRKIRFCAEQAIRDGLQYAWVDTCCIDKSNNTELSEAINSMFRWYREASKCYVYLSDLSTNNSDKNIQFSAFMWESAFRNSRWFTRGWTLQELIAPVSVEFFSREGKRLGDKQSLEQQVHAATGIPVNALRGSSLSCFSVSERISWAANRETKRQEDKAYSLMGVFDIHMPLIYGEGRENAFIRLRDEIDKRSTSKTINCLRIDDLYKQDKSRICLASLTPTNQEGLRNRAMTRYQTACQWFLNESRFQEWRTSDCSDLLYITASAGCGKTTIAAHIINALQRKPTTDLPQNQGQKEQKLENNLLLYFFFQKVNVDDEGTALAALRTLIGQLIHQMPDLYQLLRRQYDILAFKGHVSWSWEPLLSVFLGMIQQIQVRTLATTYIVLDGMDECSDDSRRNFLTCLGSLVEDQTVPTLNRPGSVLKILITSRPDEEIFDIIPFSKHFEITDSLTTDDIDTLIVTGVEQLGNRRHLALDVQSAIKNFLYTNAKGMFLWVVLVLQELDRRDERLTDDLIATRLRKVPLTLATVYEGILENVPKSRRDDMWRILRCMLISLRVMSPIELKAALCIEIGVSEWHDFIGDVKQLCGSLIRITDEKVRFVHQSAQDFLETYAYRTSTEQLHEIFWQPGEAEIQITTVCLKYLLQDGLLIEVYNIYPGRIVPLEYEDLMHDILRKWPFLSYAAEYWAFHLRNLKQPNQNLLRLTLELLSTQMNRDMLMRLLFFFTHYGTASTPREGTQLHIAAYLDLSWFVAGYIHTRVDVNAVSDCGDTALIWGSEMGSTASVELLLQAGANPNIVEYDGWSPLHWATTNGHAEICKLLLEHGAYIDAIDDHGATPRHLALSRGHDMALAELDRFRAKGITPKDQDAEGEYQDLPEVPRRPNNVYQGLYNGRLAMGTFPHLHETAQE
ncbi:hypothetical protein B0O99DRAFT_595843 [Bisporella sp. PMI_857]|nr:hypothetical protein B0O99DRAFT_595843 [Bisporella sp. PMI_857]